MAKDSFRVDKIRKIRYKKSVKRFIIPKTILLAVLVLFLAEYLNPSAIGVRADYKPAPTGSSHSANPAPSSSEGPSTTPHFMIKAEAYRPDDDFPSQVLFSSALSITEQTNQKEIFHPPAFTL